MSEQQYSIIGAGGFGHELAGYIIEAHGVDASSIVFWDNAKNPKIEIEGASFGGNIDMISGRKGGNIFIAVGECSARERVYGKLLQRGCRFATFLHPLAYISEFAVIADGCIVGPHCSVSFSATLNVNTFINTSTSVGHHAHIGKHVICSPHTLVAGNAIVGDQVLIGSGGIVNRGVQIGHNCRIAAGAVVYRSVPDDRFVTGNPGKFSK